MAESFPFCRTHVEQMTRGEGGKQKRDAGTDIFVNHISAVETDANFERRRHLISDRNDLLRETRVDAKLGILRALRRNINRAILS